MSVIAALSGICLAVVALNAAILSPGFVVVSALGMAAGCAVAGSGGMYVAHRLSRLVPVAPRFIRYGAIGLFNTVLDIAIVTTFAARSGVYEGWMLAAVNVLSFGAINVGSYFLNRYWTFASREPATVREFTQFAGVLLSSLIINTALVYILTTHVSSPSYLTASQWVVAAKVVGIFFSLVWNFGGFYFIVFRSPRADVEASAR